MKMKLLSALTICLILFIDPSIANSKDDEELKLFEECQQLFTNFLPACNPCFAASCEKCAGASNQQNCKTESEQIYNTDSCQSSLDEQIKKFVKTDAGKKCSFLLVPQPPKTRGPTRSADRSDWMASVPDDQSLALMTIPGTHESCARYGGIFAQCQTMSLTEQLNAGIRFFDIRCRVYGDAYTIHHEMVYQKMVFGGVLDEFMEFLNKHPNETILMKIKQEYSKASDFEFINIFNKYRTEKGYKGEFYGNKIWMDDYVPRLKEVRGKMVVVSQVFGLDGIQWPNVDVQDDYWVSTIGKLPEKWTKVKNQLEKAAKEHSQGSKRLFANFCSGASYGIGLAFPHVIAKYVNRDLYSYLKNEKCQFGTTCYYGIVNMDYPGYYDDGVIDLLIKQNKMK